LTVSNYYVIMEEMDNDKIKLELDKNDGAVIFTWGSPQEQFLVPIGADERCDTIRASIAFFVYATQREDWIKEFNSEMAEVFAEEKEAIAEEEKKAKRSHLKVIK